MSKKGGRAGEYSARSSHIVSLVEGFAEVKNASSQFKYRREGDCQCQRQAMMSINMIVPPTALPFTKSGVPRAAAGNRWLLASKKALRAWWLSRKGFQMLNGTHLCRPRTSAPLALSFTMLLACIQSRLTSREQSPVAGPFRMSRGRSVQLNAKHAQNNAQVSKSAALELLRQNSREAAAAVRAFTDQELDNATPFSLSFGAPVTAQFVIEDHAMRHSWHHLAAIRKALGR
jgi:hypothetical protein